jgi:polar amino acid transport system substrate-binding protein
MEIRMKILIAMALILLLFPMFSYAENILNIGRAIEDIPSEISAKVLKQAYKRINVRINFVELPAERSLIKSNNGTLDGELHRIKGVNKRYTNLIMIPIPINFAEAVVFTKTHSFPVKGWESLKPYSIAIRLGIKFAEYGTEGMKVAKFPTDEKLFMLLSNDRYDVCVSTRIIGIYQIQKQNLSGIKALEPPLETYQLYHYLHKKQKKIIPKISAALSEMEREGIILYERKQFIKKLLK